MALFSNLASRPTSGDIDCNNTLNVAHSLCNCIFDMPSFNWVSSTRTRFTYYEPLKCCQEMKSI